MLLLTMPKKCRNYVLCFHCGMRNELVMLSSYLLKLPQGEIMKSLRFSVCNGRFVESDRKKCHFGIVNLFKTSEVECQHNTFEMH